MIKSKKIFFIAIIFMVMIGLLGINSLTVKAAINEGDLVKMDGVPTIYHINNGKRDVEPYISGYEDYKNAVLDSWGWNADNAKIVSVAELQSYPLGNVIKMKPNNKYLLKKQNKEEYFIVSAEGSALTKVDKTNYGNYIIITIPDAFVDGYTNSTTTDPNPTENTVSPDLIIQNVELYPAEPIADLYHPAKLTFRIFNQGKGSAINMPPKIYSAVYPGESSYFGAQEMDYGNGCNMAAEITPGSSCGMSYYITFNELSSGSQKIVIEITGGITEQESNKNNNKYIHNITIAKEKRIPNYKLIIAPDKIKRGENYNFKVEITNAYPNTKIFFNLNRPDKTKEYDNYDTGQHTNDNGYWIGDVSKHIKTEGKNGEWESYVTIGGIDSNALYHNVISSQASNHPYVEIIYPNGNETFAIGSTQTVKYKSSNVNYIEAHLTNKYGALLITNLQTIAGNPGTFYWTIADLPVGDYKLKIVGCEEKSYNCAEDLSDATFSIVPSDYFDVTTKQIQSHASELFQNNIDSILAELKILRDKVKEQQNEIKYLKSLTKDIKAEALELKDVINYFITYGVDENTKKLGEGERAAVMHSFKIAFNKLPETENELSDTIKIANGRWPSTTSKKAETEAKKQFEKIYKHIANMDNPHDNAAITVMAYGLRQKAENRNLNSEKVGIKIFKDIYGYTPQSTEDWNIMQAITYSGASRGADSDGDLLLDERELELGTDPHNPDTDGDRYNDGMEVVNGHDPLKK